jgi:polar amino acid transport system substrate-binding protein
MLKRRGLLLAGAASLQAAPPRKLLLVNTEYPPLVMPAGEPQGEGIDIELAREALRPAGYDIELQLLPWRRVLAMLEQGQADLTTSISLSGERRRFLRFSTGYREQVRYAFYARATHPLALQELAQLQGQRLGMAAGYHYPPAIREALGGEAMDARDLPTLVAMLAAGRCDFIVGNELPLVWHVLRSGLGARLQRQAYTHVSDSPTYMALSRLRHPDDRLLDALDAGLRRLRRNGRQAAIERRYLSAVT